MQKDLVFRSGLAKQALGWLVCLGSAAAIAALIYGVLTHPEAQTPGELLSAAVIGVFLLSLMVCGISIQNTRWSIEKDAIVFHRLFGKKTIRTADLAGYGQFIFIVAVFPLNHVDLYDRDLKHLGRLPLSFKDWPRAQAWFAERFRYVVNDGSAAMPKRRFIDAPKS